MTLREEISFCSAKCKQLPDENALFLCHSHLPPTGSDTFLTDVDDQWFRYIAHYIVNYNFYCSTLLFKGFGVSEIFLSMIPWTK